MNIKPVQNSIFTKIDCINKKAVSSPDKQLNSDCFIKYNNVSFRALSQKEKRQEKVNLFIDDLYKKIFNSDFSIKDISKTVKKYNKDVLVKPISEAGSDGVDIENVQGIYCDSLCIDRENQKLFIPKQGKVFYTDIEQLKNKLGRVSLLVNSTHEFTHSLQSNDLDANRVQLANDFIDKNKEDFDTALQQISSSIQSLNYIEYMISKPFMDYFFKNERSALNQIYSGNENMFSWLSEEIQMENFDEHVKNQIDFTIQNVEQSRGIKSDKDLLIDLTINHLNAEIEAYTNENIAFNKCLGFSSPHSLARVQIYNKTIDVLKEMKKQVI